MNRMNVDERRGKLIEAAIEVMLRDGVARTTTRAIVTEAGMTTGAFHYCFFSKEEMELEVMQVLHERAFDSTRAEALLDSSAGDVIERVVSAYVEGLVADAPRLQLALELTLHALRESGLRNEAVKHYRGRLDRTEAFLEQVAESGGFTWRMPTSQLAQLTLSTAEGTAYTWLVTEGEARVDELHAALTGFLRSQVQPPSLPG
jgi:AcrR family transcriptional regulator